MKSESLYNPLYIYDSINEYPDMFSFPENNFLKFLKVVPNNKEIISVTEKNELILMKLNIKLDQEKQNNSLQNKTNFADVNCVTERIDINSTKMFEYIESNHVYDCEM
jgi:hypothetical protein